MTSTTPRIQRKKGGEEVKVKEIRIEGRSVEEILGLTTRVSKMDLGTIFNLEEKDFLQVDDRPYPLVIQPTTPSARNLVREIQVVWTGKVEDVGVKVLKETSHSSGVSDFIVCFRS